MNNFGDLFAVIRNGMNVQQKSDCHGLPITRIETISNGVVDPQRVGYAGLDMGTAKKWLLEPGDILFSHINSPTHVGRVALYTGKPGHLVHGMNLLCLRPISAVLNANYALHMMRTPQFRAKIQRFVNQAVNQASISIRNLKSIEVEVPSLEEQQRIAEILDRADEIRAKRRQQLAHLDDLIQAIFHDMFGDPKEWGERWKLSTIGELAESIQYGTSAKSKDRGSFPILRMGNITDQGRIDFEELKYTELREAEIAKYTLLPGDLLFNRTNSKEKVGKAAVVRTDEELAYAGYLVRVRFPDTSTAEIVSAYLRSPAGISLRRKLARAAVNQANISAKEMAAIRVPVLPINLQHQFTHVLETVECQREFIERALAADDELFASLQGRVFTCWIQGK